MLFKFVGQDPFFGGYVCDKHLPEEFERSKLYVHAILKIDDDFVKPDEEFLQESMACHYCKHGG